MSQLWTKAPASSGALWQKPPGRPAVASLHSPEASPLSAAEARVKNPGRRYAQVVRLKPEHYDEYKGVHAAVWPEVARQIKNCNIVDCTYLNIHSSCIHAQSQGGGCLNILYLAAYLPIYLVCVAHSSPEDASPTGPPGGGRLAPLRSPGLPAPWDGA